MVDIKEELDTHKINNKSNIGINIKDIIVFIIIAILSLMLLTTFVKNLEDNTNIIYFQSQVTKTLSIIKNNQYLYQKDDNYLNNYFKSDTMTHSKVSTPYDEIIFYNNSKNIKNSIKINFGKVGYKSCVQTLSMNYDNDYFNVDFENINKKDLFITDKIKSICNKNPQLIFIVTKK